MSWRVAASLDVLLDEVNAKAPGRSKVSDGSIGDADHASRTSDHNPWVPPPNGGVVTARDITDDPVNGHNGTVFAEHLRQSRDPRIKYVIDQGKFFSSYSTSTRKAWTWADYDGPNAHLQHTHVSVQADPDLYDSTRPWGWAEAGGSMFVKQGDSGAQVRYWQRRLNRCVVEADRIVPDGDYGPSTATLVKQVCRTQEGDAITPVHADRIEAAVAARLIRRALKSVPNAQVDVEALAREVAEELTVKVVAKP